MARKRVLVENRKCKWLGGKAVNCHLPKEITCEWQLTTICNKSTTPPTLPGPPGIFVFTQCDSVKNQVEKSIFPA